VTRPYRSPAEERETRTHGEAVRLHPPREPHLPPRWEVKRLLGSGGQADVWLAVDTLLDRMVAVKVYRRRLDARALKRLRREVTISREAAGDGLVRIHELVEADDLVAAVMDWCPGGSIADRLADWTPTSNEVVAISERILEALAELHSRGVVHRDLKPSNLLVDADGRIRIGDLGVVRDLAAEPTVTIGLAGTPGYMSPEQLRGDDVTPASDLYSLGLTIQTLLAGRGASPERNGADPGAGTAAEKNRASVSDPGAPPKWFERFVHRLVSPNPADRWPDASAALAALQSRRIGRLSRRRKTRLAAGVTSGLVAVAILSALAWQALEGPQSAAVVAAAATGLEGRNTDGRVIWARDWSVPVREVLESDLDGDGQAEIVATFFSDLAGRRERVPPASRQPARVVVLERTGGTISEFLPEVEVRRRAYKETALARLVPRLGLYDLDRDKLPEILVNCRHRTLGTAYLFVYWPSLRRWNLAFEHPAGWIQNLATIAGSPGRVRFYASNGPVGSLAVVGELQIQPGEQSAFDRSGFPPWAFAREGTSLEWYTLLTPVPTDPIHGDDFHVEADGSIEFETSGERFRVDRWGNPNPGPNAGRDLSSHRVEFFRIVGTAADGLAMAKSAERRRELILGTRELVDGLLKEPPYRAAFAIRIAQGLADAGAGDEAINLVLETWREIGYDGLGLATAHHLAIAGRLDEARRLLENVISNPTTPAGSFRSPELLIRVAIAQRDAHLLSTVLDAVRSFGSSQEARARTWAMARVFWNESQLGDTTVTSSDYVPAGEAWACLARWRLGLLEPADVDRMSEALARSPDAVPEFLIARAMARSAAGDADGARADLQAAESELLITASHDFRAWQLLQFERTLIQSLDP